MRIRGNFVSRMEERSGEEKMGCYCCGEEVIEKRRILLEAHGVSCFEKNMK